MKRVCEICNKGYSIVPPPSQWINKHTHEINRLYYIEGGKGSYLEDGVMHPFESGKVYFIPSYAGISTYTDENERLFHAFVDFKLSPPIVSKKVFCLDPSASPMLEAALFTFREFCKNGYNIHRKVGPLSPSEEHELHFSSALTLYLVENAVNAHADYVLNDPSIISALNIIHTTLGKNLTITDIATKCSMSTDGFTRKFKRYLGITPYAYIKRIRVRTALMMRTEGATFEKVAETCGYADAAALLHAIASEKKSKKSNDI